MEDGSKQVPSCVKFEMLFIRSPRDWQRLSLHLSLVLRWSCRHKARWRASHHPDSSWAYCSFSPMYWAKTITSADRKLIWLPPWPTDPCNLKLLPECFSPAPEEGVFLSVTNRSTKTGSSAPDHSHSSLFSLHSIENVVHVNFLCLGSVTVLKNVMHVHISPSFAEVNGSF